MDKRNFQLEDHALVLLDGQQFMDRIASTLKSKRIAFQTDLVEYVDDDDTGCLGPFRKRKAFSYQSEWRLVCYDGPGRARKIRIGDIRDISVIADTGQINQLISIDYS